MNSGVYFVVQPKLSQPRRATGDEEVDEFAYVRIHVHPKRFPSAHKVNWKVPLPVSMVSLDW